MDADKVIALITIAAVLALVAVPILAVALVWTVRHWNAATVEIISLQRRLADVEALRKRQTFESRLTPPPGDLIRTHLGDPPFRGVSDHWNQYPEYDRHGRQA